MTTTTASIVEIAGLTKVYGSGEAEVRALDAVDLVVPEGQFVTVMGPSGCGKSTLLNLLGGLDTPTAGAISIDGTPLGDLPDDQLTELRRRRIGFVFQFFNLIPVLNAVENASLPLRLDGDKDANARATAWLERVGLGDRLNNRPDQLSGGQQQRVAIARALVKEPKVLLADEPTGALDEQTRDEIISLLEGVQQERGLTLVIVTHDSWLAKRATRRLHLKQGEVTEKATGRGRLPA